MHVALLVSLGLFLPFTTSAAQGEYPIAGIEPSQRPLNAPVIEWVRHDENWYRHALTGIQPPYPRSLYFLDNQGYWYSPFNRPGMTGRYDLRGWHQSPPEAN